MLKSWKYKNQRLFATKAVIEIKLLVCYVYQEFEKQLLYIEPIILTPR